MCVEKMETNQTAEPEFGGITGPDSMYIKLISSDGFDFILKREYAIMSETIRLMLMGPVAVTDDQENVIHLSHIPSRILSKICIYLQYRAIYTDSPTEIPPFPIQPEDAIGLLLASNFLDC